MCIRDRLQNLLLSPLCLHDSTQLFLLLKYELPYLNFQSCLLYTSEYLINAQGEDVVAGIRTPQQITNIGSQRWAERAGIS